MYEIIMLDFEIEDDSYHGCDDIMNFKSMSDIGLRWIYWSKTYRHIIHSYQHGATREDTMKQLQKIQE